MAESYKLFMKDIKNFYKKVQTKKDSSLNINLICTNKEWKTKQKIQKKYFNLKLVINQFFMEI